MSLKPDAISYPPRGLSREEAARYIGVGLTKFDAMVADKRMPKPRKVDGRTIWDRVELDIAFSDLPHQERGGYFNKVFS
jgi:predicted DNA-binding transcriptional regulator AlpA